MAKLSGEHCNFVNSNSGEASVGKQVKLRPNWSAVREYLNQNITLEELKLRNGCK